MTLTTIRSIRRILFKQYFGDGALTVFPDAVNGVPFPIRRVFTVTGVSSNGMRGNHAHRGCAQMLVCLSGSVSVSINDGFEVVVESLMPDGSGLLIPPMLWNSLSFEGPSTMVLVFCDEIYDQGDYVRIWDEFMSLKTVERSLSAAAECTESCVKVMRV